jgi:hypothetical protein
LCKREDELHYNPYDYSQDYLTFVIKTSGTFNISPIEGKNVYYSLDNGETWVNFLQGGTITVSAGDKLMWKGTLSNSKEKYWDKVEVEPSVHFDAQGNIMSLVYGDNFKGQTDLTGKALGSVFSDFEVENAKNLILPATTLASNCYNGMFRDCTSLTTAPELPATTLAEDCYTSMFLGCTSLTTAPELPATTLASNCYNQMFSGCTSLMTAPELPATTLKGNCYAFMFQGCTNLTTAPELPATTLANYCYRYMFDGCTSMATAPELPATTLVDYCYSYMFQGCTGLVTAPELPATTLTNNCYNRMFNGCTSLTTAPVLPATTLASSCYGNMFRNCTSLNYIKAMFTTTPSATYTSNWVNGVAATGTFVKNSAAQWDVSGANGVPTGWTVQTASN